MCETVLIFRCAVSCLKTENGQAGPLLMHKSVSLASCRKSRNEAPHRPRRSGALVLIGHGAEKPDWLAGAEGFEPLHPETCEFSTGEPQPRPRIGGSWKIFLPPGPSGCESMRSRDHRFLAVSAYEGRRGRSPRHSGLTESIISERR
jgi:hypothetical protein